MRRLHGKGRRMNGDAPKIVESLVRTLNMHSHSTIVMLRSNHAILFWPRIRNSPSVFNGKVASHHKYRRNISPMNSSSTSGSLELYGKFILDFARIGIRRSHGQYITALEMTQVIIFNGRDAVI